MGLSERQFEFTSALVKLIMYGEVSLGYKIKIIELNRTLATQKEYVAQNKSKTLDSRHLDNLAADLCICDKDGILHYDGELFRPLGVYWELLGGRWGGRFGLEADSQTVRDTKLGWDVDHFEFRKL